MAVRVSWSQAFKMQRADHAYAYPASRPFTILPLVRLRRAAATWRQPSSWRVAAVASSAAPNLLNMVASKAAFTIGGAGAQPVLEDVARVAHGFMPVVLDATAASRIKRESPAPNALQLEEPTASVVTGGPILLPVQTRAILVTRLLSIMAGKSGTRLQVAEYLSELLNRGITPIIHNARSEHLVMGQLADSCHGSGNATVSTDSTAVPTSSLQPLAEVLAQQKLTAPGLSVAERNVLQSGAPATAGLAALTVQAGRTLQIIATATAALSCEALGLQARAFEADLLEAQGYKSAVAAADDLRSLLEGSKRVNTLKLAAGDDLTSFNSLPQRLGGVQEALAAANTSVRSEVQSAVVPLKGVTSQVVQSSTLSDVILQLARALIMLAVGSLRRMQRVAQNHHELLALVAEVESAVSTARQATAAVSAQLLEDVDALPGVPAALAADQALLAAQKAVVLEALTATVVLRIIEGPAPSPSTTDAGPSSTTLAEAAGAKDSKDNKKKDRKAPAGVVLGKGTALLRAYVEHAVDGKAGPLPLTPDNTPASLDLDGAQRAVAAALVHGADSTLKLLAELRDVMEANQARRKPKVAKGARDMLPEQMAVREAALATITGVFKRHGAVSIDTPVFELRETLTGKYGEDSKLIYDLADQGGELLSLRYDLTVPFARFVAVHGITNIKRYHIGKVYRRDQPQMARGRFREFYQCDLDIAGDYNTMVPDAEVLAIAVEILKGLRLGDFEIKLSHRKLLDAMLQIAGVPSQKFLTICSAIDKLDKESWETVRAEMVEEKGLPGDVADKIGEMVVLRGEPMAMLAKLTVAGGQLAEHPQSKAALQELGTLFTYLQAMDALDHIVLDLSLARGLHYYTGVIYEATLRNGSTGSIAAGGRYDKLVGMFSGKDVPAVGISIGIERIFAIMENTMRDAAAAAGKPVRTTQTEVLVASIGGGMLAKRMELCSQLWGAGIKAEFSYKANPKLKGDQLDYALKSEIPFMVIFGETELNEGKVQIKDMAAKTEIVVPVEAMVEELKKLLATNAQGEERLL